jgi:thermitase
MNRPAVRLLTAATLLALLPACGAHTLNGVAQTRAAGFTAAQAAPGQLIVRFKSQARQAILQNLGLRAVKKVAGLNAIVVKAADPVAATKALKADREVLWVEPNFIAKAIDVAPVRVALPLGVGARAGDELLGQLWGMAKIEAPAAWAITAGDRNVKVAVVDTGIDHKHPELAGRDDKGRDFINDDDDAMDDNEHGTHCAGTVAGGLNNGGVVGVAPNVSLLAVKVLDGEGSGTYEAVANGIIFAADQGAAVISMSLGGPAGSKVIEEAVNHARAKGALVVAAMGNENTEAPSYPASAPGVMAVGATTKTNQRSSFSNFGKHISVGAPGSDILSSVPGGKFDTFSGTSMATPHVAGLAALVKSRFPQATADEIKARIEKSADDHGAAGFDKQFGHGRVNARKALL